jgi:Transcriptional regulator, AbiEi antitoxin/Protein of unknown function (DUF559)
MSVAGANLWLMGTADSPGIPGLHGFVTTAQLHSTGRSRHQIRMMVERGELVRLSHGFYVTAGLADQVLTLPIGPNFLAAAAAVAALGPAAAVSHQTAALLYGIDLLKERRGVVVVTRPPGQGSRTAKPGVLLHSARLPAHQQAESPLESIGRVAFCELGLPPPELQVSIRRDEFVGRVDFLWRRYRTIVEVDGAGKYDDKLLAMRQLRRDAKLREAGYEVLHFNWQEITEMPAQVGAAIRAAFRRGAAGGTRGPAA